MTAAPPLPAVPDPSIPDVAVPDDGTVDTDTLLRELAFAPHARESPAESATFALIHAPACR